MAIGLVGRKCGMTRIFNDTGVAVPVTVIEIDPNRITQVKTLENDGYCAVQVTAGSRRESRVNHAMRGHFAKAGVVAGNILKEFRVTQEEVAVHKAGDVLTVELFSVGQVVDVTAKSKGKGFQGGVKRWNFRTQDVTHGNSVSHRMLGSTGQNQTPGKVFKGKKMPGHLGNATVTIQGLKVVMVDAEKSIIVVKGSVPGATGANVFIQPSVK